MTKTKSKEKILKLGHTPKSTTSKIKPGMDTTLKEICLEGRKDTRTHMDTTSLDKARLQN